MKIEEEGSIRDIVLEGTIYTIQPAFTFISRRSIADLSASLAKSSERMNWRIVCFQVVVMAFLSTSVLSQPLSNIRQKKVAIQSDTVTLDTLSIVPESFSIPGFDSTDYVLFPAKGKLYWKKKPAVDSVAINYRVFPLNFSQSYFHKDVRKWKPIGKAIVNPFKYTKVPVQSKGIYLGGLNKKGSISRGITFGNNQDLGVSSNLNLQLSGRISPKINILASISDQNIPVQPDGNTQQLQDFDQVYIQLYDKRTKLTAGDYQIKSDSSYFLKYNKRLRGGDVKTSFAIPLKDSSEIYNKLSASVAVSRGKFARNVFNGIEGNQGPYRLTGNENEAFIIILSGTEAVYIDGKKLKRGQDQDYVIDYNNAQITFTANQPITKDKRIVVEFQYSARAYTRSLFRFSDESQIGKLKLRFNAYSEQDAKGQPLQQSLTAEQKQLLENIGNNVNQAFVPGVKQVPFKNDRVLYKRILDTLAGGVVDTFYVYSTNPDSAIYQLSFSDVGLGKGNYVRERSAANGNVFRYVKPVNGQRQGQFEPIVLLVTPKKRQMFTVGGDYAINRRTNLNFEVAYSDRDLNTFSDKGNEANKGLGIKLGISSEKLLGKSAFWKLKTNLNHEQVSKNFSPVERFRNVEFERDWNLTGLTLEDDQYLPGFQVQLNRKNRFNVGYELKTFLAGGTYNGYKNGFNTNWNSESFKVNYSGNHLSVTKVNERSAFYRHTTNALKKSKYLEVGFKDIYENNQFVDRTTDSLKNASYEFWEWGTFVQSPSAYKNKAKLGYTNRFDKRGADNKLKESTFGESVSLELAWLKNRAIQIKNKTTYRKLEVRDTLLYKGKPEENVTSRLEYSLKLLKSAVTANSFYEVGSGLEERRGYEYLEVQSGTGIYSWTDYNGDNVKDFGEFEIAKFKDQANYIRVSTRTNDFIRTYSNQFSQSLFLQPQRIWRGKEGVRKMLSKFSDQISYRIDRKTRRENDSERFNPFTNNLIDSLIVSVNSSFRNVLYFNRTHPRFGMEWTFQQVRNKIATVNGFDARGNEYQTVGARYNVSASYLLNTSVTKGEKKNESEFFKQRNYVIDYLQVQPKVTYREGSNWTVSLLYGFSDKKNKVEGGTEKAEIHKLEAETQFNNIGKGVIAVKLNVVDITYNGLTNSPLAFEILDGLQPGKNGIWELKFQRNLGKNLQLTVNYNGRITETSAVVHAGAFQIRAFF